MTTKKQTQVKQVSSAADFKKSMYAELELPSGNVCLCKRPGLQALVTGGKIPNSLSVIIQEAMSGVGGEKVMKSVQTMTEDQLRDAALFTDIVVVECVNQPKVHLVPRDEDGNELERDDSLLYIDEVDENDKNFIFNWALGGTSSVEKFREKQDELMASLQSGEGVGQDPG